MQLAPTLARFAADARPPQAVRETLRRSLFDWSACALAGRDEPVASVVRALVASEGGAPEAAVVGLDRRVPARAAALANGAISHALDYDDTHFAHIGHTSVAVLPAALALAPPGDGAALLDAAAVGAEAAVRVGRWLGRAHYQAGFHQTATSGAFGATLAAARLLGLSPERTAHALGHAASRAAGLKAQFGTMGKPMNAGIAAATGVEAARLAALGLNSRPEALDGPAGFGTTHHGEGAAGALDGLGSHWDITATSYKLHACCHGLHAMLEALAGLGAGPEGLERVEIATHPRWLSVCNIAAPATGLEAKFSYRLAAALALTGHDTARPGTWSDTACTDPALTALRDRVTVEPDPALPETAARVTLHYAGGTTRQGAHDLATPPDTATLETRLQAKAAALLGPERAERLRAITAAPDPAALSDLLAGA